MSEITQNELLAMIKQEEEIEKIEKRIPHEACNDAVFVHEHVHSQYSFLDGMNKIEDYVKRVKELGQTACALTDHNHMGGIPEFLDTCKKEKIKPIVGVELYYTPDMEKASKTLDERKKDSVEKALKEGAINESMLPEQKVTKKKKEKHPTKKSIEERLLSRDYINDELTRKIARLIDIDELMNKDNASLKKEATKIYQYYKKQAEQEKLDSRPTMEEMVNDLRNESFDTFKKNYPDIVEASKDYMYDMKQYHIILLAKNKKGWENLIMIESTAAKECCYNGRNLCDMDLLRKYREGVITTTACIGSYPAIMVENSRKDLAEEYIVKMKEIFGEDFYLEIQPLNIEKQHKTNLFYMEMAEKHNIEVIATTDAHYTKKDDWDDHDTLLCIGTKAYKTEEIARRMWNSAKPFEYRRMRYSNDFWVKSAAEMLDGFSIQGATIFKNMSEEKKWDKYLDFCLEAVRNTKKIADKTEEYEIGSDKPLFSKVKIPEGFTPESYLTAIACEGLYKYLAANPECNIKEYEQRLFEELNIINPKGFAPYMLAVREYVQWANSNGCPTGPGRGSAAGSLCLFAIGITRNIDPIKHKLWFSRFLTADRRDPPDIDTDFSWEGRDSVVEHLEEYYGKECVCHIGTYSTLGVKSGLKDIARTLGIDFATINNICKVIDSINNDPGLTFKTLDNMAEDENAAAQYQRFKKLEEENEELFRLARVFEGIPRQTGTHASGILVTPGPVTNWFPIKLDKNGVAVTLFTGPQLEHYGAIKYDILGLKTLSIIDRCLQSIENGPKTFDDLYNEVKFDDENLYKYIAAKQTDGVFQLESAMMKGLISDIQTTGFNDIVATNALGRPGPLTAGYNKMYANAKNGKAEIKYPIRDCEDILDETFGIPCYQEQLMAISKKVSGFDDMQADSLTRKVLGKKKREMFPMLQRCHIYGKINAEGPEGWEEDENAPWYDPEKKYGNEIRGAVANGYTPEEMKKYFQEIEGFASYAFNKSHAACYSYISLLTAHLKYYYPAEFMAASMSVAALGGDNDKVANLKTVCEKKMGLKIETPDINRSGNDFTPSGKSILYGLSAIKGVGATSIPSIIANAPYASLEDAYERLDKKVFNKTTAENLIKAGAFDFLGISRNLTLDRLHEIRGDKDVEKLASAPYTEQTIMKYEEETLGTHITCHSWWEDVPIDKKVILDNVEVKGITERTTEKGMMAFLDLKRENIKFEGVVFYKYPQLAGILDPAVVKTVRLGGKKSDRGSFIVNEAFPEEMIA